LNVLRRKSRIKVEIKMISLNTGLSLTILTLFFIVIVVGYVYIDESRRTSSEAKDAIKIVNKTQAEFLQQWKVKQDIDNVRFNQTLDGLQDTYNLIVDNQKLIINLSNYGSHASSKNLNLTKFNRAALVDTNHNMRIIAEHLNITLPPFNASRLG